MRIALLINSLGFGGAQRQIVNLAIELKNRGHEVSLLRYHGDDFYLPLLRESGISPITVECKGALQRLVRVRRAVRRIAPDALISFMGVPNFCAAVASIGRRRWKLIVSERIANESLFISRRSRILRGFTARCADVIACNSRCAQELWEKYYPRTRDKLTTIYNIIDVPALEPEREPDGKCRVVVAARYEREKNPDGLIRAVALLSAEERERLEVHWYGSTSAVAGAENYFERGCRLVSEHGLGDCIFLHPATDKIYPIMADADFVGLFSYMEGLPNAIIEGMTLRKPVIMSTVSDYAVLVDETNGFTCDPASDESIAEALRRAISTTAEQRARMGESSCERIGRICSREAVIAQWEALL